MYLLRPGGQALSYTSGADAIARHPPFKFTALPPYLQFRSIIKS
jgi:hypothetical protein